MTFKTPTKKFKFLFKSFSAYYFLKVHLHHFSKIKSPKEVKKNSRNQGFSYYFCLMIEGPGSIPPTNGSGSGRPKNIWIPWIRIRKTATNQKVLKIHFLNFVESINALPKPSSSVFICCTKPNLKRKQFICGG